MVIVKCDRCGKEVENIDNRYFYDLKYDFCDECQEAYDKTEKEISNNAIKMRKECENKIKEMANKMIEECLNKKED